MVKALDPVEAVGIRRCRSDNNNEEGTGVLEDVGGFWEECTQVNKGPNPFVIIFGWELQCSIGWGCLRVSSWEMPPWSQSRKADFPDQVLDSVGYRGRRRHANAGLPKDHECICSPVVG